MNQTISKEYTMEAEAAMESTDKVIRKAVAEANPLFDAECLYKIKYTVTGRWHQVTLSAREFTEIMATGSFEDRQLAAIELFTYSSGTEDEDGEDIKVRMIYDFVKKHTNENPWVML